MKGREIVAKMRAVKEGLGNVRAWCDQVEGYADEVISALAPPVEESAPDDEPPPSDFTVQPADGREEWTPPSRRGTVQFEGDAEAKSVATLVTPKQLGMIRALARECGVDYEVECQEQFNGLKVEALNKRAEVSYIRFADFVAARPPEGLGADVSLLVRICAEDPEALDLLDRAVQNGIGSNQHTEGVDNVNARPDGNERQYALRKLRKDRPDLHALVLAEKLSPHAAMVEAGFRRRTITLPLDVGAAARSLLKHFGAQDIDALIAALKKGTAK
jgi:hypothetical protein